MSKALDTGKSLVDLVLAKLPESLRDGVKTAFAAPEAADALTELGARGLAQSDYSKNMDAIRQKEAELASQQDQLNQIHTEQTDWWTKNQAAIADYTRMKTDGEKPPPPPEKVGISREDLEKFLAERDQSYASVLGLTTTLTARHIQMFQEAPDMQGVIAEASKRRISLEDAYRAVYGEKLKAHAEAAEQSRIDKLVQERLTAERAKQANQPYPLRNGEASVLDALNAEKKPDGSVDEAVAEYHRLQGLREAGTPVPFSH